jgi:hypothetical protein
MSKRKRGADALAMQKVVINYEYRDFSYAPALRFTCDHRACQGLRWATCRVHPDLVAEFEYDETSPGYAEIVAIPMGLDFRIVDYDGHESLCDFVPKRGLDAATTARLLEWIRNRYEHE